MSKVKIDSENVLKAYKNTDEKGKQLLKDLVDGQVDFNMSIIDRTPTVEAALAIAGTSIAELTRPTDAPHETACRIIEAVINVLRDGKVVDHSNSNQTKYEPRFVYNSGLGLSCNNYDIWYSATDCGPRLCYLGYDEMIHGVKILEPYYNIYLNSK